MLRQPRLRLAGCCGGTLTSLAVASAGVKKLTSSMSTRGRNSFTFCGNCTGGKCTTGGADMTRTGTAGCRPRS